MTGKDPFETGSGGSFRAFIFSSGVETLDIEAFRDDRKQHFPTFQKAKAKSGYAGSALNGRNRGAGAHAASFRIDTAGRTDPSLRRMKTGHSEG
jgi:hypothetical protein